MEIKKTESEIAVHTDQPSRSEGRTYEVDYHVRLPKGMRVAVELANGTITIATVTNSVDISLINGNVSLAVPNTTSARLEAKVSNGSVSVSGLQIKNMISSRSSVSGILGDGAGAIHLASVNGNLQIQGKD